MGTAAKRIFYVRVFHPNAPSYRDKNVAALFRKHELDKKREYDDRIREVENGSFTPLVFSTTGGASRETTVVFKRLAELLANKRNLPYSITLAWMRCHVSFALMESTISCIRGSRVCRRRHTDMGIATQVNRIWSTCQSKLPKNIFNFTNRYINNSLPTRKNLNKWGGGFSSIRMFLLPSS